MAQRTHPNDAIFAGEKRYPIINACERFAGSEKLIGTAADGHSSGNPFRRA